MPSGTTALHVAVFYRHANVVEALLSAGANPDAVSSYLQTPRVLVRDDAIMHSLFERLAGQ